MIIRPKTAVQFLHSYGPAFTPDIFKENEVKEKKMSIILEEHQAPGDEKRPYKVVELHNTVVFHIGVWLSMSQVEHLCQDRHYDVKIKPPRK